MLSVLNAFYRIMNLDLLNLMDTAQMKSVEPIMSADELNILRSHVAHWGQHGTV